jgi:hypothetical protein
MGILYLIIPRDSTEILSIFIFIVEMLEWAGSGEYQADVPE